MRRRQIITLITILVVAFGSLAANLIAGNSPSLGLDLQGGASVTLEPREKAESEAIDVAVEIIRKRVDSIGVAEPEIIRQGDTIVVNLPGVKDQQSALNIVGRTGEVQLRPVIAMSLGDATTTTTVAPSTTAPAASSTLPGETTTTSTSSTTTTTTTTTTTVPTTTTTLPENEGGVDAALPAELSDKDGYLYSLGHRVVQAKYLKMMRKQMSVVVVGS
jgi:preprotein translocase subunit SecD